MADKEEVLVIERKLLDQIGVFQGIQLETDHYLDLFFRKGSPRFMTRSKAENDPSFKQLIPYVIIAYKGKFLSYVRGKRAGETRLTGKRSVGFGGHINPIDHVSSNTEFRNTYLTAVQREVAEEIDLNTKHTDSVIALINDDSNEVGQVHLGIVHLWELESPNVNKREQMITQMDFMTPHELRSVKDTLETWSYLCLDNLL